MSKRTDEWAVFAAALQTSSERRPTGKGWLTVPELMAKYKVGKGKVLQTLRSSNMEKFSGTVMRNNRPIRQIWYRPKP